MENNPDGWTAGWLDSFIIPSPQDIGRKCMKAERGATVFNEILHAMRILLHSHNPNYNVTVTGAVK